MLCWLLVFPAVCLAAEPVIMGIQIGPDLRPRIGYTASSDSYYLLLRGNTPTVTTQRVAAALFSAEFGTLVDPIPIASEQTAFYRVLAVPVAAPEDSDGDRLDDVYELLRPLYLDPLDPNDFPGMVWIPPGTFLMGSPESEAERRVDEVLHQVTLTQGFWMAQCEVKQGEYVDVIGSNPSYFRNGVSGSDFGGSGGVVTNELDHPVEEVTWIEATNYCALMTDRELLAGRLPEGYRYRLPTETEWEYACRAGTTNAFHYGAALRSGMVNFGGVLEYDSAVGIIFNSCGTYLGRTTEVGSYSPNAFGLYDMHGNVWEWCQDWYGDYPTMSATDPKGPVEGFERVFRGGGWFDFGGFCRSANRDGADSVGDLRADIGFRVVLAPGQP